MTTRTITFTKAAIKALRRMPANDAARVIAKIDQYAADPESLVANATKLVGSEYTRLRVGNYRVIMLEDLTVVEVLEIGVRGGIYK
ncbi:type II toxin-antitoxin system RelE family toxin [Sphingomonas adhaesiva]|uniref:type II toxin-antitoxin system RelE family toxin n=1 Tax=Sphingomonas adhaesiva TaxID=28212 RepID=UPI002FF68ACD